MKDAPVPGAASSGTAARAEFAVVCALMFFAPLFEVPKQLLWLAWLILWMVVRGPRALYARPWSPFEWALCAVAASALTAGLLSGHWASSLGGAGDAVRVASVAWLIARGGYRPRQLIAMLGAAVAGTLVALGWALVELLRATVPSFLELHSVGHVNHSAIYLAIAMSIAIGLVIAEPRADRWRRACLAVAALLLGVSLFIAASRAALGAAVIFLFLLAWAAPLNEGTVDPARRRWAFRLILAALLSGSVLMYGLMLRISPHPLQPPGGALSEKYEFQSSVGAGAGSFRDGLWRVAALAFLSEPVFGIGNDQFGKLSARGLCPQAGAPTPGAGEPAQPRSASAPQSGSPLIDPCDATRLHFASHAHSVYANSLAERGLVGFLAIAGLLGAWAWLLVRSLGRCRGDAVLAGLWCASLGGWSLVAIGGTLNTTLHHEHGMLAMLTLGALISAWAGAAASGRATAPPVG